MTAPATVPLSQPSRVSRRTVTGELAHQLLDRVVAARIQLSLAQDDQARRHLLRAFDALVLLDDALTPEPPAAPAAGPRHVQETAP